MKILQTWMEKKEQIKQLQDDVNRIEQDERFKREVEFKNQLEKLMKEYDRSASDVLSLLQPGQGHKAAEKEGPKRPLKVFKNRHTGEVVETRGGNQKTLKAWRDEYGKETVSGWQVQ